MLRSNNKKYSEYINLKPARNLYHAPRIANTIEISLNVMVSINYTLTDCDSSNVSAAFRKVVAAFRKWITRPTAKYKKNKTSASYSWVIKNPPSGHLNVHWLVYVPKSRQADFKKRLHSWVSSSAEILDTKAIHVQDAYNAVGATKYMLKGIEPSVAVCFGVRPERQGWIQGKRSGFSKNIGSAQKKYSGF